MTERRRSRLVVALLFLAGAVIYLPALRSSFLLDDYLHSSMISGTYPAPRSPFDLYNFVDDSNRALLIARGLLPWWTHPELTIRFFRPLSSALLFADHKLLGNALLPLHLHSFLWWAAVVLAARALFRRLLAPRPALLATIIFAIAPCHTLPLAWIANREALVSLTFGIPALSSHVRFREGKNLRDGVIAAALFAVALLGGEYALCFGGYVLALEIATRGEGPLAGPLARALGVLPFALPAGAYLLVRSALHYGTAGSGFYSDPFREPAVFLRKVPRHLVTSLAQGWFSLDVETLTVDTPWWALLIIAVLGVALLAVPLVRAFGRLAEARRKTASWMLLGSFLSLAPVLAVVPSPRTLGASMLGIAASVAVLLDHAWFPRSPKRRAAAFTGLVALVCGFVHLVHGPMTAWLVGKNFQKLAGDFASHVAALRPRITDPERADVVVIRGGVNSFFLPFALDERGTPPSRFRMLAQTGHLLALRRGPRTLDIVVARDQSVFPCGAGHLFRSEHARLAAGDTFTLPGMSATILEVGADGPRVVRFEFERELDAPSPRWINEEMNGFLDAKLPEVGFGKPFDP